MKRVIVRVRGEQTGADGETDVVESAAEGRYYYRNGKHYVTYNDGIAGEAVSTLLRVSPDALFLMRRGAVTQEQRFMRGLRSESEYRTSLGCLAVAAETSRLEIVCGDGLREIHVEYALFIGGARQSDNALHIEIAPADA